MNDYRPIYRPNNTYDDRGYRYSDQQQSAIPLWNDLMRFTQQRPGIVVAGALIGGFLLSRYWSNHNQPSFYRGEKSGYRPMWSYAPEGIAPGQQSYRQEQSRPADHMGATEDQMSNRFAMPSRHDLEEGAMGTTGSAYELDPDSITAG